MGRSFRIPSGFTSRYKLGGAIRAVGRGSLVILKTRDFYSVVSMLFQTSRLIPASPAQVFAAIADAERLARWWGPAGFTNTFECCDFSPGGAWSYVMHGPDGKDYRNESIFQEIEPPRKVVIRHVSKPRYLLTITLEPIDGGHTRVHWEQVFDNPKVAEGIAPIVVPANEQNLDRLNVEVLKAAGSLNNAST